jgi:hypothetical protein
MKCNETLGKWCKNKHGASKIMDTLETYQAAALVAAKATTPAGAPAMATVGATPADSVAAAAASAAKVFLLQLPGGRPRLRGTGGVVAGSFALFLLPNGRPHFRPPDPLGTLVPTPPRTSINDMEAKEMGWGS